MACWVTLRKKVMEETQTVIVNLDHVKVIERFVMGDEHLGGNNSMLIFNYVHDGYDCLHFVETQEAIYNYQLILIFLRNALIDVFE